MGIFENIVYSSEISVSKENITINGIFEELDAEQLIEITDADSFGINLNNISLTKTLDVSLNANEHLTVITLVDGGFDVSSAIIPDEGMAKPTSIQTSVQANNELKPVEFYPSPASKSINCKVYSESDNNTISIKAFNLLGRDIGEIYSGNLRQGYNLIEDIDISNLPKGIQILQVRIGNKISSHKITID